MKTLQPRKTVFNNVYGTATVTLDASKVTHTRDSIKFLPAGTIIGADATGDGTGAKKDMLLDRTVKGYQSNGAGANGILIEDIYFEDGKDAVATIGYHGEAILEVVNEAQKEVKGSSDNISSAARSAMPLITLISAGHRKS